MKTSKQSYLEFFLKEVFGFEEVVFSGTVSRSISCVGFYPTIRQQTPFGFLEQGLKVPMIIWQDKCKDGSHTLKFKTREPIAGEGSFPGILEAISKLPFWRPVVIGVDIYNRISPWHLRIPTLRVKLSGLPWVSQKKPLSLGC